MGWEGGRAEGDMGSREGGGDVDYEQFIPGWCSISYDDAKEESGRAYAGASSCLSIR